MTLHFHRPARSFPLFHHKIPFPNHRPFTFTLNPTKPTKPLTTINPPHQRTPCRSHAPQQPLRLPPSSHPTKPLNPISNFYGAIALIVGTAVGPGMLALPSATIKSGTIPSTMTIILSWIYVISSILLVAELSFAAMEQHNLPEVSFTSLATEALGPTFGAFVAVIYASLSFALIIACVSGIGSLVAQQFPLINTLIAHSIFPLSIGAIIGFFPFKAIDAANRLLCGLMLLSITALVAIGLSVGRRSLLGSLANANFGLEAVLPAIPVTVLTLGFHVITPFVCKIAGDSIYDARRAILIGGAVPLAMVLAWNAVVLGMAVRGGVVFEDPIKLLLSINTSALPAVQGFAFAALATSLIGYAVSFPKQLADTMQLILQRFGQNSMNSHKGGQVGFVVYSSGSGEVCFSSEGMSGLVSLDVRWSLGTNVIMWGVLIVPVFVASFFNAAFTKALDFAGVYANCFLFGVLPPAMAWIHRSRKRYSHQMSMTRGEILPGGSVSLVLLFVVAVMLGFWH